MACGRVWCGTGGAHAKAVVAINKESKELRSGQFDALPGFEHWRLKFDGTGADKELGAAQAHGRFEYANQLMARAAGTVMMDCDLLKEGGRAPFITQRFDRHGGGGRHHIQTLCAMEHLDSELKGAHACSQLLLSISQLGLPCEDLDEAYRRMVFNVLARNCDNPTKKFSFLVREVDPIWRLAPA